MLALDDDSGATKAPWHEGAGAHCCIAAKYRQGTPARVFHPLNAHKARRHTMQRRPSIRRQRKFKFTVKRTLKRLYLRAWLVWMAIGPVPHDDSPPQRLAR